MNFQDEAIPGACEFLVEIDRENISDNSTPSGEGQSALGLIVFQLYDCLFTQKAQQKSAKQKHEGKMAEWKKREKEKRKDINGKESIQVNRSHWNELYVRNQTIYGKRNYMQPEENVFHLCWQHE